MAPELYQRSFMLRCSQYLNAFCARHKQRTELVLRVKAMT